MEEKAARERATRGAVLAEFVITVVPVLMMFFGWMQLAWLYTANLLAQHAANVCVRAAAVIDDKGGLNPGDNGTVEEIQTATQRAAEVQSTGHIFESIRCSYDNEASEADPYGTVTATVTAEYGCAVPMGRVIVCGPSAHKTIKKTAKLPFQGARYGWQ